MGIIAVAGAVITGGIALYNGAKNRELAEGMANDAATLQRQQQAKLDKQKAIYKAMKFENPYKDMENVYEDLTVNQLQAKFQAEQGSQQRANIMQSLKGAAGSSGIAGLAQSLANQSAKQTQQISASIGMQEQANQKLAAQGASNVQTAERQGDQFVQQSEMNRQATLLGMQMGETSGANLASQQAQANQMNAQIAQTQAMTDMMGNMTNAAMSSYTPPKSGTACFVKNSKILMNDGTLKNIQEIKAGNKVRSKDGKTIVKRLIKHDINDVYRVYTNGLVNTTADHPLYVNDKWTNAEKLGWDNELTYVKNLYNIETENSFIVDGVITSGVLDVEFKQI
tara:strand:+ start:4466 stop:5482 length:1017 start_codon:yes stop_codon:yes gene_type:complete